MKPYDGGPSLLGHKTDDIRYRVVWWTVLGAFYYDHASAEAAEADWLSVRGVLGVLRAEVIEVRSAITTIASYAPEDGFYELILS